MTRVNDYLILLEESDDEREDKKRQRQFVYRFRMKPESFWSIIRYFGEQYPKENARGWSLIIEILVFLRWITSGSTFTMVADTFDMPLQSISDIISRILPKFSRMARLMINLPDEEELEEIAKNFRNIVGTDVFSHVAKTNDGSLIKLTPPLSERDQSINRKGNAFLNMTIICDHKSRVRRLHWGYPGSSHDSFVLMNSGFSKKRLPPHPCMILGDDAYRV